MFEQYVIDALEMVSAWNLPDEYFTQAVNDQAILMAGIDPNDFWDVHTQNY